jgi:hypothetical protein
MLGDRGSAFLPALTAILSASLSAALAMTLILTAILALPPILPLSWAAPVSAAGGTFARHFALGPCGS